MNILKVMQDYYNSRDPATDFIYLPITDMKELSLGSGYLAPVNIANSLTNQLTETGETIPIMKTLSKGTAKELKTQISSVTETPTMKAFPCGANQDWSQKYYTANRDYQTTDTTAFKSMAMQYLSNYEIVGFKRPEIQLAIRNNSKNVGLFEPKGFIINKAIGQREIKLILTTN